MPSAASTRPVVFPLFGIVEGRCACGEEGCTRIGKHPRVKWGELKAGDEVPRPEPGAGVGLKTGAHPLGSDVFVVDLDSQAAADAWEGLGGNWTTYIVDTPRGWHLYFKHPGFHVKTSASDLGKGIDIRGDGGFVVAAGSPHASGGVYRTVDEKSPILDAPLWLLDWLRKQPAPTEVRHYPGDVSGPERSRRREQYTSFLRDEAPLCVKGQSGDSVLFKVVQRGAYDLALPVEDVLELIAEHYDPRCEPPWGSELEERVRHKAHDAKTVSTRPRAEPLPDDISASKKELPIFKNPETITESETPKGSLGETWGGWDKQVLPPVYLLEGIIPEAKVVTFFAEGGSVKTWSALALAIAVATGKPWLGQYAVKKGKVLFLDYEDGPYEVSRRVGILNGRQDVPDLGYLYGGPNIDQVDLWTSLARKVIDEQITLVVVDSLGAGMPGDADENTTAFAQGMKIAGRFTETGCTVVFVHHANKTGGMRGTSAARDQSDCVFKFEPVSETDAVKRMRMICDKPGPQRRPKPVNVELTDDGLRTFEDEVNKAGRNAKTPEDIQSAILLAMEDGRSFLTKDDLREAVGKDRTKVYSELKNLIEANKVAHIEDVGYVLNDPAARTERVLEKVRSFSGRETAAALAYRAHVSTEFVKELILRRVIVPRVVGNTASGFQETP